MSQPSESGQPRSDTVSPNRLNLNNEEGIAYMPVIDVNETQVKEFEICPILTQHFVYPFINHIEPTLVVKILTQNVIMLLDTAAHVSVLPKKLITDTISLVDEAHANRHVKVFGGEEVVLDAEIPAIGGYDLLRAAHIIIDNESAEVWSKHPDVVNQSSIPENVFATV